MAKENFLIIEDDPDIVELVQYNLEREGFRVFAARDGESGLKEATSRRPNLILLDQARSREMDATGLGLTIVKHLVQAMHGEVRVESEPGKGSRFVVQLPAA